MAAFSMKSMSDFDFWSVCTTGEISDVTQAAGSKSILALNPWSRSSRYGLLFIHRNRIVSSLLIYRTNFVILLILLQHKNATEKVSHGPQNTKILSPIPLFYRCFTERFSLSLYTALTLSQPDPHTTESGSGFVLLYWCCSAHHVNHLRRTIKNKMFISTVLFSAYY